MLVMCHEPKGQPSIICVKIQQIAAAPSLFGAARVCVRAAHGAGARFPAARGGEPESVMCPLPPLALIVFVVY